MNTWFLIYYLCFALPGEVTCTDYVPVARFERFADCRAQRNLYIREQLRYWQRHGGNGNALCVESTTGRVWSDYNEEVASE